MNPTPPRRPRFPLELARLQTGATGSSGVARPQRPLHEAARDAQRRTTPSGHGLDSEGVRARMVQRLRAEGIAHEAVLAALSQVPRHRFVDSALAAQAYEDTSLPIGLGQTISKPSVVARMLALLMQAAGAQARGDLGRVLEIGTGCGYQTALLARLGRHVVSVERLKGLHDKAALNLADWRGDNRIRLVWGDGREGHPPRAPYDTIIAAAVGDAEPAAWRTQLAPGGRLVAPVVVEGVQRLRVVDHGADGFRECLLEAVRFVPLKSGLD